MNQQIPEFGWWIKITTSRPSYVYYFGAFKSYYEATRHKSHYVQDLSQEGNFIADIQIVQCQPEELTVCIQPIDITE